jgi:hypothetical protein
MDISITSFIVLLVINLVLLKDLVHVNKAHLPLPDEDYSSHQAIWIIFFWIKVQRKFTIFSSFNGELLFVASGWSRSGFDLEDVVHVTPHVFERDNVEFCFNEPRDCVRVVGGLPDEHRLLFDDIEI